MSNPVTEEQLKAALEPITREVNDTLYEVGHIKELIELVQTQGNKSYKYLFGNGEAGLDERVRTLEAKFSEWVKVGKWFSAVVGGYLIVEIIKILLTNM